MSGKFCARVTCGARASAALLINARDLSAQLVDIQDDDGVAGVPLCRAHADGVVVPLGWTLADSRTPFEGSEFEPELVLVDDAASESPEAFRLPDMEEAIVEDMEDAAVGEVPPLLSRAFRAAGID
ncbi:DUF3499 family protein [Candidatus Poriferisocius sp.]|uniref:DUF3499 family protein n=1 Tax=Candidatus Poriferisocius sp. TaxID=3101276 RepID=UPI003B014649